MSQPPKTALITGGSRGIGRECALRLAQAGYNVCITYISKPEQARETCSEIENRGGQCSAFQLDMGSREAISEFFAGEIRDKVDLQVLVNNAGMTQDGLLVRMKPEQWENVIRVNLTGPFTCLQQAAKIMMRSRYGRIINLSSVTAQTGNAGQANYTSAKAGIIGLTKTAAQELAPRNITVNSVAPGFIDTDMTGSLPEDIRNRFLEMIPLKRLGTTRDVAACVAFLASEEAGYITGQVLGVNGGLYM